MWIWRFSSSLSEHLLFFFIFFFVIIQHQYDKDSVLLAREKDTKKQLRIRKRKNSINKYGTRKKSIIIIIVVSNKSRDILLLY